MNWGPVLRGSITAAIVVLVSLSVDILTATPERSPPTPELGERAIYSVTVRSMEAPGGTGDSVGELTVDVGPQVTIADSMGDPTLAHSLVFTHERSDGRLALQRIYWHVDGDVVHVQGQGQASIQRGGTYIEGVPANTGSEQPISWQEVLWPDIDLPCGFWEPGDCDVVEEGPWPERVTGHLGTLLGSPGPGNVHELTLQDHGQLAGNVLRHPSVSSLPPTGPEHRFMHGPDGADPALLPIQDAFDALMTDPTDPAARDLAAQDGDAYIAYARHLVANNAAGQIQPAWHLVLRGSTAEVERVVVQDPQVLPGIGLGLRVLRPTDLDYVPPAPPTVLAPPNLAPDQVPGLDDLSASLQVTTGQTPNGWRFAVACTSTSCFETAVTVEVYRDTLAESTSATWSRELASHASVQTTDGVYERVLDLRYGQTRPLVLSDAGLLSTRPESTQAPLLPAPSRQGVAAATALGALAGVLAAAWPFLKAYVPLFSRIEDERLLEHPLRRHIHDLVQQDPGIHANEVAKQLEVTGNTANHHLAKLVAAGYIGERRVRGFRCFFPRTGLDERIQQALPILKSKGAQRTLLAIESQGAPSFQSLIAATGLGYATVHYHATRLWKAGLVSSEKDGRKRRFRVTDLGRRLAGQVDATLEGFPTDPKTKPAVHGS